MNKPAALFDLTGRVTCLRGHAASVAADVTDRAVLESVAANIFAPLGAPEIVVHAAGLNLRQAVDDVTEEGWDATLAVNLTAPFFLSRVLLGDMRKKGWGRIVNFASRQTTRVFAAGMACGATKGGIGQLTRAVAEAWSKDGIMFNAIGPGVIPTELTQAVFRDSERAPRHRPVCVARAKNWCGWRPWGSAGPTWMPATGTTDACLHH